MTTELNSDTSTQTARDGFGTRTRRFLARDRGLWGGLVAFCVLYFVLGVLDLIPNFTLGESIMLGAFYGLIWSLFAGKGKREDEPVGDEESV